MTNTPIERIRAAGHGSALSQPANLFSGGVSCAGAFFPEDILVWKSASDSTLRTPAAHQRMILKVILSGKIQTISDGFPFHQKAGDMILFFPYQLHSAKRMESTEKYSFLAISFLEKHRDYSALLPLKNRLLSPDMTDARCIETIVRGYLCPKEIRPEQTVCALTELLFHLRGKTIYSAQADLPVGNRLFSSVCEYIRQNFQTGISLKTVAAEFNVSTETLRRMFLNECPGVTPGDLIRRLRLQLALELLEHSALPIGEIAKKCGFLDAFTFSRSFKRMTGIPPIAHRNHFHGGCAELLR